MTWRRCGARLRSCASTAQPSGREVELTHLSTALVGADDRHLAELVDTNRPRGRSPAAYAAAVNAGTVDDHVGRFRDLADAGVAEVVLRVVGTDDLEPVARVIEAFRG